MLKDVVRGSVATARLTRLVTTDDLGDMLLREPAEHFVAAHWPHDHPTDHSRRLLHGLDCPFCVGFWIGAGVLASYSLAARRPATLGAWRFVTGALALNYVTAHVSARID